LNEISNISKDAFIVRLNQIRSSDGEHAARLAAFVIASRMGAEKVRELFFAKSAVESNESLHHDPQTDDSLISKSIELDASNVSTSNIQQLDV
jgi:hypothetical protein